jgi:hypothetical protein
MGIMRLNEFAASNPTAIAVGILLAIGGALITLDQFRVAEGIFGLAGLWGSIWLWFQPYRPQFEAIMLCVIAGVLSGLIWSAETYRIQRRLELNHGWLEPANDSMPSICGDAIARGYKIIWMPNLPVAFAKFPDTIIKLNGHLLSIDVKDGLMSASADVFGRDGRVIAVIKDNEFTINNNNYLRKENPDVSTLIIYDQFNNLVLDIRYMNVSVIKIRAVLRYGGSTVTINDDGLFVDDKVSMEKFCMIFDQPSTALTFNQLP